MTEGYGFAPPIDDEEKFYIRDSRQYVGNCILWWRHDRNGYTTSLDEAGQFSKDEADLICQARDTDMAYPVYMIDEVAERHVDHQDLPELCEHVFIDATNEVVSGMALCVKCGKVAELNSVEVSRDPEVIKKAMYEKEMSMGS
jgi:hypothetical protein